MGPPRWSEGPPGPRATTADHRPLGSRPAARAAVGRGGLTFLVVMDSALAVAQLHGVHSHPTVIVAGRQRRMRYRLEGLHSDQRTILQAQIASLPAEH